MKAVCAKLLEGEPKALIQFDRHYLLQIDRTPGPGLQKTKWAPSRYYLASPLSRRQVLHHLKIRSVPDDECLVEFFARFSRFRVSPPPYAAEFLPVNQWVQWGPFLRSWHPDAPSVRMERRWRSAYLFFTATNGDSLLISQDLHVAWFCHETEEIVLVANSFQGFVEIFAHHMDRFRPFDGYEASDGQWQPPSDPPKSS